VRPRLSGGFDTPPAHVRSRPRSLSAMRASEEYFQYSSQHAGARGRFGATPPCWAVSKPRSSVAAQNWRLFPTQRERPRPKNTELASCCDSTWTVQPTGLGRVRELLLPMHGCSGRPFCGQLSESPTSEQRALACRVANGSGRSGRRTGDHPAASRHAGGTPQAIVRLVVTGAASCASWTTGTAQWVLPGGDHVVVSDGLLEILQGTRI